MKLFRRRDNYLRSFDAVREVQLEPLSDDSDYGRCPQRWCRAVAAAYGSGHRPGCPWSSQKNPD